MPMLMGGLAGMTEHLKLRNWVDAVCTSNSLQTSIPAHVSLSLSCDRCIYIYRFADCFFVFLRKGYKNPNLRNSVCILIYGYWCFNIRNTHTLCILIFHQNISKSPRTYKKRHRHGKVSPGQFLSSKKSGQLWKSQYMIFVQRCLWEHPPINLYKFWYLVVYHIWPNYADCIPLSLCPKAPTRNASVRRQVGYVVLDDQKIEFVLVF